MGSGKIHIDNNTSVIIIRHSELAACRRAYGASLRPFSRPMLRHQHSTLARWKIVTCLSLMYHCATAPLPRRPLICKRRLHIYTYVHCAHEILLGAVRGKHMVMLWLQHSWAQCIPMAPMKLQLSPKLD